MERISKHELKKRFERDCPEEAGILAVPGAPPEHVQFAGLVWRGYKMAFKSLGILLE